MNPMSCHDSRVDLCHFRHLASLEIPGTCPFTTLPLLHVEILVTQEGIRKGVTQQRCKRVRREGMTDRACRSGDACLPCAVHKRGLVTASLLAFFKQVQLAAMHGGASEVQPACCTDTCRNDTKACILTDHDSWSCSLISQQSRD